MSYAIIDAIDEDDIDKVKRLLEETPELINHVVPFYDGKTPIHLAKSIAMLQVLINLGANINAQQSNGDTALIKFNDNNLHELVLFLINIGADINIVNNRGKSILDYYIIKIYYKLDMIRENDPILNTIYKLLLNKGAKFKEIHFRFFNPIIIYNWMDLAQRQDVDRLNLVKKNNMILQSLVAHPESFNIDYARPGHPTVKYPEYLRETYNITFDELRSTAGEMARERRMLLLNTFLRARGARARPGVVAVASAVAVVSAPPVASAVAAVSAPPAVTGASNF